MFALFLILLLIFHLLSIPSLSLLSNKDTFIGWRFVLVVILNECDVNP